MTSTKKTSSRTTTTKTDCKYGTLTFYDDDMWIGRSLALYGEYSDYEVEVFKKCLRPGFIALELGANIGSLTVPMAQLVGPTGKVIAFEPGFDTLKLLRKNVEQNGLGDIVEILPFAASDKHETLPIMYNPNPNYPKVELGDNPHTKGVEPDAYIQAITVDSLNLPRLDFAKIDVDGCEQFALEGMKDTIARCRPIIFIENEIIDKSEKLTATIIEHGYRGYWYRPPLFRFENHAGVLRNIFPGTVALMQIYIPEEMDLEVKGCDEVADIRTADPDDTRIFIREIERYQRLSARWPDDLNIRLIAAHYMNLMQWIPESKALIAENLRRDPNHIQSLAIEGLHMLQAGNYKEGWQRYELRYQQPNPKQFGGHRKPRHLTQWDGQPTDEPLLIWSEQGFGDTAMFIRYYKYVMERAPNAILEVQPEMYELVEQSRIAKPGTLYRLGRELPDLYGKQCSLPSLPAALQDDGSMIPVDGPYLFADPIMTQKWQEIIGDRLIGVCWEGSKRSERPYTRDLPVSYLRELDLSFGPFFSLTDEGQFESFASTAAAIMALDLVITVDTSVAHVAGALGKDVWLLLAYDPDFRWGLTGNLTPWYPTMRIFRQPSVRNWRYVIEEVRSALEVRRRRIYDAA
jgi:FkbM family methyltransferase